MGMLELLAAELTDQQSQQWHASAMRSAQRLERLTTRLITYVELENVDLRLRGVPKQLSAVLHAARERWRLPCLRAGQLLTVELQPSADALIPGPPGVDLLFDELMSNIVDHANPGAVMVTGRRGPSDDAVLIEFQDPGPGVDPAVVARVLDFQVSSNQTQLADSTINLGLALVDRIVTGLAGTWEPTDTNGSAIVVTLPIAD
jgi:signal transduction histidine kinase